MPDYFYMDGDSLLVYAGLSHPNPYARDGDDVVHIIGVYDLEHRRLKTLYADDNSGEITERQRLG